MYTIFLLSLFLFLFICLYRFLTLIIIKPTNQIKLRMIKYVKGKNISPLDRPLLVRIVEPITKWLSKKIENVTPEAYKRYLERKILLLELNYKVQDVLLLKLISSSVVFICGIFYGLRYTYENSLVFLILIFVLIVAPDILLSLGLKKKREMILYELPLFLDLLVVILEGGSAFDSAVQKICQRKKGPLYHEFNRYIQEVKMGSPREEALKRLMIRVQLEEFNFVIRSILHSEKMGIGILETIRNQSIQLRSKRRNQIREEAMKIPIKILFPLVLFIFPPIFIVILGPGIIQIFRSLFT